jgi:hypothetical protein
MIALDTLVCELLSGCFGLTPRSLEGCLCLLRQEQ